MSAFRTPSSFLASSPRRFAPRRPASQRLSPGSPASRRLVQQHLAPQRLAHLVLLLAFGISLIALSPPASAQSTDAQAEALFAQGTEHYKARDWTKAYEAYTKAFALKQSYDIAGNLGDVELILGKKQAAARHLAYSLANWPAGKQDAKARTQARLDEAKSSLGAVRVTCNVSGAEVLVNGDTIGKTPINVEIFVDPGAVNVQAQKQGYSSEKRTVAVAIGETKGVEITLEVSSTTSGPNGDSGAQVDSKGMPPKTIALIAGGALTAIAAGVGTVSYFRMKGAEGDGDDLNAEAVRVVGPNGCTSQPNAQVCADLADANDRGKSAKTLATVGFVGAGVFLAATAGVWFLWPEQDDPKARRPRKRTIHVAPSVHPNGFGLTLGGTL